ncbi:phosphotransferase enzyme family protein [Histoplasma ohiense]|nr:phosphotransferase enzyme family protein [Histoplasma ohiense (nom. inval.)]
MPDRPEIQAPWVADATATEMDFLDSSFFASKPGQKHLPTTTEVAVCSPDFRTNPRPKPVKFEHLGLIVKFGPCVVVEEAVCLRMLRKTLPEKVPVPEVYGWRVEEGRVFIYMELIHGETLHDRWDHLNDQGKISICAQLKEIVAVLRQLEPDPSDSFIGSITRRLLLDYVFQAMPSTGPFKTVKEFNDWFSALPQQQLPDSLKYKDPYREFLPDDGTIRFTHGDLHRGNIIVSRTDPPRVMAVIDWTHAGWYPDYWEYCKALYTSDYNGEWRNTWIPRFLEQYPKEFAVFSEYIMQIGAV